MIGTATVSSLGEDIAARTRGFAGAKNVGVANLTFGRQGRQFGASGGGGSNPDQIAANITRSQWQHFLDTYRPVEEDILKSAMQTDFSSEGDKAGAEAASSVTASRGTLARNLSRAGSSLSTEERSALGRRTDLSLTKAVGRAENTTRRTLNDTRTQLLSSMVGIGNQVANTASAGSQSVADQAAQREMQYKQQKTAAHNQNMSMAASAAAMLIFAV